MNVMEVGEVKEVGVVKEEAEPLLFVKRFNEKDPIRVYVTWGNKTIPLGTRVHVVVLFLVKVRRVWERVWYYHGNNRYYWGSILEDAPVPRQGDTVTSLVESYVYEVCKKFNRDWMKCGVEVRITKNDPVRKLYRRGSKGRRVIGLLYDDVRKLEVYGERRFHDVFEVRRVKPEAFVRSVRVEKG